VLFIILSQKQTELCSKYLEEGTYHIICI